MHRKFIFFVIFIICFSFLSGQVIPIYKTGDEILDFEKIIQSEKKFESDTIALKKYLEPLRTSSREDYHIIYEGLLANGFANASDHINPKSDLLYTNSINKANTSGNLALIIWTKLNYASYLYNYRDMTKALPVFMTAIDKINHTTPDKMILPGESFMKIGYYMGTLGDYQEAIFFLKKGQENTKNNTATYASILDNIGQYYFKSDDVVNARKYFNDAGLMAQKIGDDVRYGKTLGNLAMIEMKNGNYKNAIQLLKEDIDISEQYHAEMNKMFASTLLAEAYFKNKQKAEGKQALKAAEEIAKKKTYYQISELEIEKVKLLYAESPEEELAIRRKITLLEEKTATTDGELPLNKANWKAQKIRYAQNIEKTNAELERQEFWRYSLIGLATLIVVGALVFYADSLSKIKDKQLDYDTKLLQTEFEKNKYEKKLLETEANLKAQIEYLKTKNVQIQYLKSELQDAKNSKSEVLAETERKLQALLQSQLMTEQNWQNFKKEFIKENPTFYENMMRDFPNINETDLRILIFQKLGFSGSEIASLVGTSVDKVSHIINHYQSNQNQETGQFFPGMISG